MTKRISQWLMGLLLLLAMPVAAQDDVPERPTPPRLVNDLAGLLDARTQAFLEDSLVRFARRTSTQIVVLTTSTLNGLEIAEYAYMVGDKWGVGQKGKDNGVVMVVKPKTADSKGRAFFATGYGVEGALPDITCAHIVNDEMIPHFRDNENYAAGIVAGAIAAMQAVDGEYSADPRNAEEGQAGFALFFLVIVIVGFVIYCLMSEDNGSSGGNGKGRGGRGRRRNNVTMGDAVPWIVLNSILNSGGRGRSDWGSFRGGSGDFGGFGGGSFGGGGGGGSW